MTDWGTANRATTSDLKVQVLQDLLDYWLCFPEHRLGQLLINASLYQHWAGEFIPALFSMEDKELLERIQYLTEQLGKIG